MIFTRATRHLQRPHSSPRRWLARHCPPAPTGRRSEPTGGRGPTVDPRSDRRSLTGAAKLAYIASPTFWLFSGWNWQAIRFSRQTIAGNGPGWSASAATSSGSSGDGVIRVDEVDRGVVAQPLEERRRAAGPAACSSPCAGSSAPAPAGTGRPGPAGARGPRGSPSSSLASKRSCRPRQTPRHGLPARTASLKASPRPVLLQLGRGVGEGPDAGQDHLVGAADRVRVGRDLGGVPDRLDRLLDAPEVAHPVVDDGDHGFSRLSPFLAGWSTIVPAGRDRRPGRHPSADDRPGRSTSTGRVRS